MTGGTKGLGAAIARHLDAAGARVVVAARSSGDETAAGHFIRADFNIPLGRIGSPDDIAEVVTFLASPRANDITGAVHVADGGLLPTV